MRGRAPAWLLPAAVAVAAAAVYLGADPPSADLAAGGVRAHRLGGGGGTRVWPARYGGDPTPR